MKKNRVLGRPVVLLTLAAGLALAWVAVAQVTGSRPKSSPCEVAFIAPDPARAAVASYDVLVTDLTRGETTRVDGLAFQVRAGDPTEHVIFLELDYYHNYKVRVRAVDAAGVGGPWSDDSDRYEHASPYLRPQPPEED